MLRRAFTRLSELRPILPLVVQPEAVVYNAQRAALGPAREPRPAPRRPAPGRRRPPVIRLRRSLRTRLVVVFGATFVRDAARERGLPAAREPARGRTRLESAAHQYALIATPVVAQSFDTYFNSGYFKFRQLVIDLLARSEDVTAILICDVEGRVLFDSRRHGVGSRATRPSSSAELDRRAAGGGAARAALGDPLGGARRGAARDRGAPTSRTGAAIGSP